MEKKRRRAQETNRISILPKMKEMRGSSTKKLQTQHFPQRPFSLILYLGVCCGECSVAADTGAIRQKERKMSIIVGH